MKLQIAGGCGEHGRNCFHVIGEHTAFLVDCGQMAGNPAEAIPGCVQKILPVFAAYF